jgi:hypothetical protein
MPHSLILGQTESGKTTLAKRMCQAYGRAGVKRIVLDPMNDPGWQAEFRTTDPDAFLAAFWASESCAAFIDEAGESVGRFDLVMQRTATKGRHWGHNVHYLTQRGTQLAMTVRDQCSHLFLFTTGLKDCKTHADEWNQPLLLDAASLKAGEYFHVNRFGLFQRGNIFQEK